MYKYFLGVTVVVALLFLGPKLHSRGLKNLENKKRVIVAKRFEGTIHIDANLDEEVWSHADSQTDFIQYEPHSGALPSENTEIRVLYDNTAIYIGAKLFDSNPAEIYRELGQRDKHEGLKTDMFSILISPYNDGINYQEFMVLASGVQCDTRYTGENRDESWDAVWESSVAISDQGWVVEIRIPYSALRFSKKTNGRWGINFRRLIKRHNEWSSWNPIDLSISGMVNQSGEMEGISGIDAPIRLSLTPYVSGYVLSEGTDGKWNGQLNGGLDFKLGLSDGFTLDVTLIPDFGQVKSDDLIFNVTPYEVQYDEHRPFFTEGMDLFSKGGIFYSRRIGTTPKFSMGLPAHLHNNEVVESNPSETKMLNAVKVSGRMGSGLGMGFFNAITGNAEALVRDTVLGTARKITTQGLSNYNITVFDQTLRYHSYVSLINTNLLIPDTNYLANVTATEFVLRDKSNTYALQGDGAFSLVNHDDNSQGHQYGLSFNKTSGNYLFKLKHQTISQKFNPNDLGYIQKPNQFVNGVEVGYAIYKPFWRLLNWSSWLGYSNTHLFQPREYTSSTVNFSLITTFAKSYLFVGAFLFADPCETHDYDEPRSPGRMVILPRKLSGSFWLSSDYRKTLAYDLRMGYYVADGLGQKGYSVSLMPRVRFSNSLFMVFGVGQEFDRNSLGYAGKNYETIYMGRRNSNAVTNTIEGLWAFNAKSSLSIRVRHYWRWLKHNGYYELNNDGTLSAPLATDLGKDASFGLFNVDLTYQWNFAPGSVLTVMWKNAIEQGEFGNVNTDYYRTLVGLFDAVQYNSISFKMIYYLDYQTVRGRF